MRAGTHAAMPVLVGILRAVDGRGVVVAKLCQLQQEVHLLGRGLVDEPFVQNQNLAGGKLAKDLLLGPARPHPLLSVCEHVWHPDVHGPYPVLARLLSQGAGEVALAVMENFP